MFDVFWLMRFAIDHPHVGVGFIGGCYVFLRGYQSLGATEPLVREAMLLGHDNSDRDKAISAIDEAQKAAVFDARAGLFIATMMLVIFSVMSRLE